MNAQYRESRKKIKKQLRSSNTSEACIKLNFIKIKLEKHETQEKKKTNRNREYN